MKYLAILFLIGLVTFTSIGTAYGLWIPQPPEELLEQSETVFVGTVTSVNVLEFERSNTFHIEENGVTRIEVENYTQTLDEYTVDIEEFLKNPQTSKTITMLEATVGGVPGRSVSIGGFELGDRVLFFIPNLDGTNQYSPESFKIPKQCDAKSVLEQPRVFLFNDFKIMQDGIEKNDNFVANKPIKFVYNKDMGTLEGKNFDINIKISKITGNDWETSIDENIHTESKLCEWISTASWELIPTEGRYYMWMNATEGDRTGVETTSRGFTVKEFDSPLKQFNSGISIYDIQCNDSLILVTKHDGSPACIKPETKQKLIEREWTKYKIGITVQFSFCGADGFDSEGNLNSDNSTHHWDENECEWQYIGPATNSINKWAGAPIYKEQKENYPFGLTGPEMSQQNCNDYVISQWQPRVKDREMVQQFLEICIQRGFMTHELVERGKVADNFTMGPIQSAQTLAKGDIEKTIEILEEMYRENEN